MIENLTRGTQIIYVPKHANGDIKHPDCEWGFVTSVQGDSAFCRYWKEDSLKLKTTTYSELTPVHLLVAHDTVPQELVINALEEFC